MRGVATLTGILTQIAVADWLTGLRSAWHSLSDMWDYVLPLCVVQDTDSHKTSRNVELKSSHFCT